ncbi:helix-turn-helix domain-containing protein [Terrimonas rubra]|uniref:Helix-turn-helix domain-containing protein n=1 Tax=Terrimonas rubra TaxID=1035890 RepID=A0ABW6A3K4_9BACT
MYWQDENNFSTIHDVLMVQKENTSRDGINFFEGGYGFVCKQNTFRPDTLIILLVKSGSIQLRYNMCDYIIKEGNLFFGFHDMLYEVVTMSDSFSFSAMTFSLSYAEQAGLVGLQLHKNRLSVEKRVVIELTPEKAMYFTDMLASLQRKARRPRQTPLYEESLAHGFLSFIYDLSPYIFLEKNEVISRKRSKELTEMFLTLVANKYRDEKTVKYYASVLGISARHLSKVVKDSTGKIPHTLIAERTIHEAKILLTEMDATVAVVSDQLRFANQSLFGRFFKRYTGVAPKEYRRQNINYSPWHKHAQKIMIQ